MEALLGLTGRQRQNVERKAARFALNQCKTDLRAAWRSTSVVEPTKQRRRSIRGNAAKALTVKVSTSGGYVHGRIFLNYHKKNAARARLAHLLEWGHAVGGGRTIAVGKSPTRRTFHANKDTYRDMYMGALGRWIHAPKTSQKDMRGMVVR
jgi:hypothetical protein